MPVRNDNGYVQLMAFLFCLLTVCIVLGIVFAVREPGVHCQGCGQVGPQPTSTEPVEAEEVRTESDEERRNERLPGRNAGWQRILTS